MKPYLTALAGLAASNATACGAPVTSEVETVAPEQEPSMSAATSPTGEPHPGDIVNDDKVDGRTWTVKASEVPPTIGWVQVGAEWQAVVRIEISGTPERRRITKFGVDGTMLESTVMSPPPQPRAPDPMPMPTPESE